MTTMFFVRHAESIYVEGQEKARGLSPRGRRDAERVMEMLGDAHIDHFASSDYARAIQTIQGLADRKEMEIELFEGLRERTIGKFEPLSFAEAKQKVYDDRVFSFSDGESSRDAQDRAIGVILQLLQDRKNQTIVIGTHGDIMTLMMNYFDNRYDFEFWRSTTMPDIYQLDFDGVNLKSVSRHWDVVGHE